ncbi:MAG: hypothetical protein QOF60_659 [Actinomycetota bacterium]|jgi:hypothetical protein|nr:hypothetical protein [Actinomycetota bacterium]
MTLTPARLGRRYAPLVALAAVQVLLVAVAPSGPPQPKSNVAAGANGFVSGGATGTGDATGADGSTGTAADGGTGVGSIGANGTTTGGRTGTGAAAGAAGTAAGGGSTAGGTGTRAGQSGPLDMSRCDKNGRQIGPTYYMPLCQPVWKGGDNGGATMQGVSATEIKFLLYQQQGDAQVNAILQTQGLAATQQQSCQARDAFTKELNKRYEFYGRKFTPIDGIGANKGSDSAGNDCGYPFFLGRCQLTPPDPPCARQEAEIIATQIKPAIVYGGSGNAFYNELAKRGVPVIGGSEYPNNYYSDFDGLRYDVFMDGSQSMEMMSEYYCKRLAGKPVKWAGPDILQRDGAAAPPPKRKVGILYPKTYGDPVFELSAQIFIKKASACGGETVNAYPYESDINKAQQQSTTTVTALKADKITTVVCFCDPIAPAFLTATMNTQGYHPEQLMTGTGLIDYDVLGRLYDPTVWKYAFGLSHLQVPLPFAQSDATKAWQDAGLGGQPDATANLPWAYFSLLGNMLQNAGPNLNLDSIKQGMFKAPMRGGWTETKGDPHYPGLKFKAGDFTGIDDAREVYWCSNRVSEIDGKPGSYAFVDNGHRYLPGEWPSSEPKVFPDVAC